MTLTDDGSRTPSKPHYFMSDHFIKLAAVGVKLDRHNYR